MKFPFEQLTITDNHVLAISQIGIQVEGDFYGDKTRITGELRQGPGKFPLVDERIESLPVTKRPQEPKGMDLLDVGSDEAVDIEFLNIKLIR